MLDENQEEKKSKRKEFEAVLNGLQKLGWHYNTIALTKARWYEEGKKEHAQKVINEPLELTEEEKRFDEEYKREVEAVCCMEKEEWKKWNEQRTKKWWNLFGRVHIKGDINEMKASYRLALQAQTELCSELCTEAQEEEQNEWFKNLPFEQQVAARLALRKQRESCIKLQNEILQVWEDQLVSLNASMKDFPFID